ncbi:MAG: glycosyltransferase family 1 protein [Planctomycetota bacterium]|nr:MAG: glycosyltransferase family 1 protein [Planctomycetota bacterium]
MKSPVAKIVEVGPYPPPLAGWSMRIQVVREFLLRQGHDCQALNIGKNRAVPSDDYVTVLSGRDYIWKTFRFAMRGYTMHAHANGDGAVGMALAVIAAVWGCLFGRRIVLSFHAGVDQQNFPRERSRGKYLLLLKLMFKLSKKIICNNNAVKEKIVEYGVSADKIVPIKAFSAAYVEGDHVPLPAHVEEFFAAREPVVYSYIFLREGFHLETFVAGVRRLADRYPKFGVATAGSTDDYEGPMREKIMGLIDELNVGDHICFAGDLSHDEFLTLARRSKLYLRTPTSDGECSSVLEALTMGVPVVAAENGTRPESVVTYTHDDPDDLCAKVCQVLENHEAVCQAIVKPPVRDTVADEADVLIAASLGEPAAARCRADNADNHTEDDQPDAARGSADVESVPLESSGSQ